MEEVGGLKRESVAPLRDGCEEILEVEGSRGSMSGAGDIRVALDCCVDIDCWEFSERPSNLRRRDFDMISPLALRTSDSISSSSGGNVDCVLDSCVAFIDGGGTSVVAPKTNAPSAR